MKNQVSLNKIIRNIASNGVEYEEEIRKWVIDSDENMEAYQELLRIWQITGSFPERFSTNRPKAWLNVQRHIRSTRRTYRLYHRIGQAAAVLLVILTSVWVGTKLDSRPQKEEYTEVFSPFGQKTRITLPDRSIVLLNGNSQLKYSRNFNDKNREVELTGEGYFEVQKDSSKQFVVKTHELDVKVFGTSFNVKAYENDQTVEVGLKDGQIGIDRNEAGMAQLTPGQTAVFDKKELKLDVVKMDMNIVSAWTRDEIVFEEDSLQEIVKYMERWYGVNIQVAPELIDGELLTFKVKTESLSELLKLINIIKPIKYTISGKQVIITKP